MRHIMDGKTTAALGMFGSKPGRCRYLPALALLAFGLSEGAFAQSAPNTPEELLSAARTLMAETDAPYDAVEASALKEARAHLDRIVTEFPASDLAVRILIQDQIDGMDVAELDAIVAGLPAEPAPVEPAPVEPVPVEEPPEEPVVAAPPLQAKTAANAPSAEGLLKQAQVLVEETGAPYDSSEIEKLREARQILDRIVSDFPTSDLAVRVLVKQEIDGLDIARLDSDLASLEAGPATSPQAPAAPAPQASENLAPPGPAPQAPDLPAGIRKVGTCYVTNAGKQEGDAIIVEVKIDQEGKVAALPEVIDPPSPTSSQRMLFVDAITALDTCAPYGPAAAGLHRLSVSRGGMRLIETRSAETPPPAPAASLGSLLGAGTTVGMAADRPEIWLPASAETQKSLDLARKDVAEIQARLTALGIDPNGIDGVSGKGTRAALATWQQGHGMPATGYLDRTQHDALKAQSEAEFLAWKQIDKNRRILDKASVVPKKPVKKTSRVVRKLPPGYFWYKGRMCRKVFGNSVYSCK